MIISNFCLTFQLTSTMYPMFFSSQKARKDQRAKTNCRDHINTQNRKKCRNVNLCSYDESKYGKGKNDEKYTILSLKKSSYIIKKRNLQLKHCLS
jgi:hypothetical protein